MSTNDNTDNTDGPELLAELRAATLDLAILAQRDPAEYWRPYQAVCRALNALHQSAAASEPVAARACTASRVADHGAAASGAAPQPDERERLRADQYGRALLVLRQLDDFQRQYQSNTGEFGRMPGNDYYGGQLMGIVRNARSALELIDPPPCEAATHEAGQVLWWAQALERDPTPHAATGAVVVQMLRAYAGMLEGAAAPAAPAAAPAQPRWRHKRTGGTYVEVHRGHLQASDDLDMAPVVVYRSEADGRVWVRPVAEFEDGRFERISGAAPGTGTGTGEAA